MELICWSCGQSSEGEGKSCSACGAPLDERMSKALKRYLDNVWTKSILVYVAEGIVLLLALTVVFASFEDTKMAIRSDATKRSQVTPTPTPTPTPSPTP